MSGQTYSRPDSRTALWIDATALAVALGALVCVSLFGVAWPAVAALLCMAVLFATRKWRLGFATVRGPVARPLGIFLFVVLPLITAIAPMGIMAALPATAMCTWSIALFCVLAGSDAEHVNHGPLTGRVGGVVILALATATSVFGLLVMRSMMKMSFLSDVLAALPRLFPVDAKAGVAPGYVAGIAAVFAPIALAVSASAVFGARRRIQSEQYGTKPGRKTGIAIYVLSTVLLSIVTLLTQSRSGILAMLAGLGITLLLLGSRGRIIFGIGLVIGIAGAYAIGFNSIADALLYAGKASGLSTSSLFTDRTEIWERAVFTIRDFPWTGLGPDSFGAVLRLYPLSNGFVPGALHAHNAVLQTMTEFGIIGIALLVWAGAHLTLPLLRFRTQDLSLRAARAGALGALVSLLVFGFAETFPAGSWYWIVPCVVAAFVYRAAQNAPSKRLSPNGKRASILTAAVFCMLIVTDVVIPKYSLLRGSVAADMEHLRIARSVLQSGEGIPESRPTAQAEWLRGMAFGVRNDSVRRDSAWTAVLASDEAYVVLARCVVPGHAALAERAVLAHPQDAAACFWLAGLVAGTDTTRAIALYKQGLSDDPHDGLAWRYLGDLLVRSDPRAAIEAYLASCMNGDPGANGCLLAGITAENLGLFEDALRYYRFSRWSGSHKRAEDLEKRLKESKGPKPSPR